MKLYWLIIVDFNNCRNKIKHLKENNMFGIKGVRGGEYIIVICYSHIGDGPIYLHYFSHIELRMT